MLDEVQGRFRSIWSPNQQLTVDESMVNSAIYAQKTRALVWIAANALSKYLWNFDVYCGKNGNSREYDSDSDTDSDMSDGEGLNLRSRKGEGLQGRHIVKYLLKDLVGKGHIVTTDNFFTSVPLFLDLLESGIMATSTLSANRIFVPQSMYAKTITKNQDLVWIDYCMYEEYKNVVQFRRTSKRLSYYPHMRSPYWKRDQSFLYGGK
jgi:hypothetical protein